MAYDRYHFPVAIIGEYKYKAAGWNGSCRLLVVVMTEQSKISSSIYINAARDQILTKKSKKFGNNFLSDTHLHFPPMIYYGLSGKHYTTKQEILKRFIGARKQPPIFLHTKYKEYSIDNHNILW